MLESIWGGVFVSENALSRCIKEARTALDDDAREPRFIRTIPRVGFKFIAGVETGRLLQSTESRTRTIAVLPFKPLVVRDRDESLEMGMADTLILRLSRLKEIVVRSIHAVRRYADLDQDPLFAGREQQVDAVLEGSIQKGGRKLRVTARLLKVSDGSTLWMGQFDEKASDIFAVQDSISEKVAEALQTRLTRDEIARFTRRHTASAEAYQLYAQGRHFASRLDFKAAGRSIECFTQAVKADPKYALAYAGIAQAFIFLADCGAPSNDVYPRARAAAIQALELDDELPEAHAALGYVSMNYSWDWPEAGRRFERALELDPNNADVRHWHSMYFKWLSRFDEAVAEAKLAQSLAPLSFPVNMDLALILDLAGRREEAARQIEKTIEMYPDYGFGYFGLALIRTHARQYKEALSALQTARTLSQDFPDAAGLAGYLYAKTGRRREALKCLQEIENRGTYVPPFLLAGIYGELEGDVRALELLERACEDRSWHMVMLKVEPLLDPLRRHPRFKDLLQRVGFTGIRKTRGA
jgi:serine/threonine-protein kinase